MEKTLPSSLDAEKSVLGAIYLDNKQMPPVLNIISASDFYDQANAEIFNAMKELYEEYKQIDIVTVTDVLIRKQSLEACGGRSYVAMLASLVPTASAAVEYARIIKEKARLRKLVKTANLLSERAASEKITSSDILNAAQKSLMEIAGSDQTKSANADELMKETFTAIADSMERGSKLAGLSTGFGALDKITQGLKPASFNIIAARPSMGKTALGLNIALNVAVREKARVAIFSIEMSKKDVGLRFLAMKALVGLEELQVGKLTLQDQKDLSEARDIISNADLIVNDSSGIGTMEIISECRRLATEKKLDLILIDYLQLITSNVKVESRQLEIAQISRQLKLLAKEMDCPVICISQLSRAAEKRAGGYVPMLSDLRDSGAIEQDADVVMLIYRDDYYKSEDEVKDNLAQVIVAKNRNGRTGTATLAWRADLARFANLAKEI